MAKCMYAQRNPTRRKGKRVHVSNAICSSLRVTLVGRAYRDLQPRSSRRPATTDCCSLGSSRGPAPAPDNCIHGSLHASWIALMGHVNRSCCPALECCGFTETVAKQPGRVSAVLASKHGPTEGKSRRNSRCGHDDRPTTLRLNVTKSDQCTMSSDHNAPIKATLVLSSN